MAGLRGTSFSLRGLEGEGARAAVVLDSITLPAAGVLTSTGDIDLQATTINLIADTTLTGAAISLTGAIDESNNFDIIASGVLTLNSGINLGTGMAGGSLTISAGRINVPNANTAITAMAINITFTDPTVGNQETGFTTAAGTPTLTNAMFTPDPTYNINLGCVDPVNCVLDTGSALQVSPALSATASILINTGTEALTFSGTGPITISAPTVMITAGDINIGTRALTITASNGSLTLNADIRTAATSTAAIMLAAINGPLTLVPAMEGEGDRAIGGPTGLALTSATLTLSSTGTNSELVSCAVACFLGVAELTLTQTAAFGGGETAPYRISPVPMLNLTTSMAQTVQGWMEETGRSLSLTTDGVLTLNNSFNVSQNNDATLSGASIVLVGTFTRIRARNITLRGAVSTSLSSVSLTAEGVITIHNDINVGTGALTLISSEDISNGGAMTAPTLTADTVSLMQDGAFGSTAVFTFAANTLALTTAAAQTVQPWMVGTTRDLSLMAGGDITLSGSINLGTTRALSLTAGGDITLSGNIDLGTRGLTLIAGMGSSTANSVSAQQITAGSLSVRAPGNITLNGNIDLGAGALDLRAGVGDTTGNVVNGGTARTIMAGALTLTQDGLFTDTLFNPASTVSGAVSLRISTEVAQTIHPWMVMLGTGDFSLQGTSGVTLTSITAPTDQLSRNAGTIDLRAATVNLGAEVSATGITLIADTIALTDATIITAILAGSVAITGTISIPANLTIQTSGAGRIVFNSDSINLDPAADGTGGILTLTGAGGINFTHEDGLTLTAISMNLTGDVVSTNLPLTIDTSISSNINLNGNINTGTGDITLLASNNIQLARDITLTGGDVALTGNRVRGDNFGLRVNAGGDITLNFRIGVSGGIELGTGRFDLRADTNNDGIGAIINSGTVRPLTAGDVFLQQTGTFAATSLFAATGNNVTGSVSVRLTAGVPQTIRSWMVALGGTDFSLAGVDGVVLSSITTTTALTRTGTIDLYATRINLDGDLTASAVVLRADTIVRTGLTGSLSITATSGGITTTGADGSTGVPTLDSTVTPLTTLTLTQNSAFGSSAPFTFNAALTSLTLQTAAPQTAYSWMAISGGSVSLTSTGGDITIGGAIDVGTGSLTLIASGNILPGTPRPRLIADTVNFELTGADSVFTSRPFLGTSQIDTLTITTAAPATAPQEYRVWMAPPAGTNRNLTITSATISINSTAINLGTGNLTFNSGFGIRLTNMAGLTITAGNVTFPVGGFIAAQGVDVSQLVVMASGDIMISDTRLPTARVELRADNGNITINPDTVGLPGIRVDFLLMRQMGMFADNFISSRNSDIRELILRTTTAVDQPIYDWMRGAIGDPNNNGTRDGTRFSLRGSGEVLTSITTTAARDFGTTAINLRATAITLGGALTGGVVALRTNTITVPGALAAIHATAGDITAITITDMGGAGQERPTLTTSATSLSLEQTSAFGGRGTLPFTFEDAVIGTALTLSTRSEQLVRSWMIRVGTNLTITSSDRVVVNTAIGAGNRNLGGGDLTLTSTGGAVRIVANITTGGAITLSGGTGGINLNSTPTSTGTVTLTGAAITLSGNALSNRALIITATSGALTLSGAINTGTSALTLSGSSGIALGGALTLTGGSITLSAITGAANASLAITADTLTLNNDITLTGTTSILALRSRQGAITGSAILTAPTVRLRQFAAFAEDALFTFGSATGSLLLITDTNQDVHDWMIALNRNLTVRSSARVRVDAAIGSGNRNLGTGSLTLRSTGGIVRILADISTTGSLTLIGPGTIVGTGMPVLTASTVSLSQADAFAETALFMFGAATGSLEFTTTARQDVHNWMIRENTNLTVTSSDRVRVLAAIGAGARNLGNGSLTLTSTGGDVRIVADITTTGDVTLDASGILTISSNIDIGANALTLTSGGAISNGGVVVRPLLTASTVSFTQDAAFDATRLFRFGSATGSLEFTTTVNQDVHNWMIVPDTNLTVTSSNRVRVLAAIGSSVTGRDLGNGSLTLTSTGRIVRIVADISTTGDVTLTASGILTISSDITLTGGGNLTLSGGGAISNGGNVGANRPLLTAGTVSFRQDAAFATTGPFRFGSATGSLVFTTTVNQDVHNWMIRENTNLTVTSSDRVRVLAAIGMDEQGRNLGNGSLTLTSTGRIVRIVADISTTGDATITASSILTINNDINIGTGALTLEATSFDFGSNVDLAAGSHSFTPNMTCNTGTSPSCTVNTP